MALTPAGGAATSTPSVAQPRSSAKSPSRTAPVNGGQEDDPPVREPRGEPRTHSDGDGEDGQVGGDHLLVAAEHGLHQGGQERQDHCADQPEPAHDNAAPPQPGITPEILEERSGRTDDVPVDVQRRRRFAGMRDHAGRAPAQKREKNNQRAKRKRIAAAFRCQSANDCTEQNRHEGGALDQGIASG